MVSSHKCPGLLLFIIYINTLVVMVLVSKVLKFADDTKLLANLLSPEDVMELLADLQKNT